MPIRAANSRILIDQFDFSQQSKGFSLAIAGEALETNTLQSLEHNSLPGWPDATLDLNGYFNGVGAGLLEQELRTRLGSETPCVVSALLDTGAALPTPAYVLPTTWGSQLKIDAPVKELLTVQGQWTQPARRGFAIYAGNIIAATGQTIIDLGVVPDGAATGWVAFHVTGITGTAVDAILQIQMSTALAFTSPTNHGSVTFSNVGGYQYALTGTMKRYVRVNVPALGGATGIAVVAVVGVSGVTY